MSAGSEISTACAAQPSRLELWGGVEATVNRVGDHYFDQIMRSGHDRRADDLERFAALGFSALRYPLNWERIAPYGLADADWLWADRHMERLRTLGMRPIVGLVHHGSGAARTSLVDPDFVPGLAAYAGAVAARYPWVEDYTPVNEPLTTARFATLYGHWYPHARDDHSFARALLIQCKASVVAMEAIRAVNPRARLVQTEDVGRSYGTPHLAYQVAFENERRWLSLDLLHGRVTPAHPLWGYLRGCGLTADEILWFQAHPCPPEIIGLNVYLTSERWLDERVERFPPEEVGGNGREAYADVAAVHMLGGGIAGPRAMLGEAWQRYGRPVALTETHLGCTREEQLRWLVEAWEGARRCRSEGADVRAVTVWSLLGAFDWNSLLTRETSYYEPGPFDVRGPAPRPTALATLAAELAADQPPSHPAIAGVGWWHRPERFIFGPADQPAYGLHPPASAHPLLIVGAGGTLGRAFVRLCRMRGLATVALTRGELDLTDAAVLERRLAELQPWAVVNAAGYVRVDAAEHEPERCFAVNSVGSALLAAACARLGVRLLTFSSDLVFAGSRRVAYIESDQAMPLNTYGLSKAGAEHLVLEQLPSALVVRTSAFFGPWDAHNFVTCVLQNLAGGGQPLAVEDEIVSPTYVPDLVQNSLDLLIDHERGIWHLANQGAVSWAELARRAAALAGFDPERVRAVRGSSLHRPARRPRFSVLGSARGLLMPPLEQALVRYFADRECAPHTPEPHAKALERT